MTRPKMTEANWQAIARVMFAVHQRRAARQETGNGQPPQPRRERQEHEPVGDHDDTA
jgi:hypothetical protein